MPGPTGPGVGHTAPQRGITPSPAWGEPQAGQSAQGEAAAGVVCDTGLGPGTSAASSALCVHSKFIVCVLASDAVSQLAFKLQIVKREFLKLVVGVPNNPVGSEGGQAMQRPWGTQNALWGAEGEGGEQAWWAVGPWAEGRRLTVLWWLLP